MSDLERLVQVALEEQIPLRHEAKPDWEDVLRRADGAVFAARSGTEAVARRRPRRLVLALALLALIGTAASPLGPALAGLGRDAFDGLSAWLRGEPGEPAPASEQTGFATRNAGSYAAFARDTKLRLLLRTRVAGKRFSLLGFRSGSSLCLRLVRADLPAGRGANQCVTVRELTRSPAPALVASETWLRFGRPELTANGVFGFADDTVRAIEIRRTRGSRMTVPVSSNVFLALRARRSGTIRNPPPYDPIVQVRALTKAGGRVSVPFVASDSGDYGHGLPNVPSFLKLPSLRLEDLPGPAKVAARFPGGTIRWLERHERRGEPFSPDPRLRGFLGSILWARAIQPDPQSPFKIGVVLARTQANRRFPQMKPGQLRLCEIDLEPLAGKGTGTSCPGPSATSLFPAAQPFTVSYGPAQITRAAGLAADGVARIDLYLASGRIVPAELRDNAYVVEAPTTQFPGKLVAYNKAGAVIGLEVLGAVAKPAPCPTPSFPKLRSPLPAAKPYERLELGDGTINGARILGLTPAQVEAVLGRPTRIGHFSSTLTLFYGGRDVYRAALIVQFGLRADAARATVVQAQGPAVVDERLGHLLRLAPLELQRRIPARYRSSYRLDIPYGSQPSRGCVGSFEHRGKRFQLQFGISPYRPAHPFLIFSNE